MSGVTYLPHEVVDMRLKKDWANLLLRLQQLSGEDEPPEVHLDLKNMTLQVCGRVEKWGRPDLVASG